MNAQYYPQGERRVKQLEFLCLTQGEMSIIECEVKFNELS